MKKHDSTVVSRRGCLGMAALASLSCMLPNEAYANMCRPADTDGIFEVSVAGQLVTVSDNRSGETATVLFEKASSRAILTYSDKTVHEGTIDENGSLYIDGAELAKGVAMSIGSTNRSVPSGYIPLTTNRYSVETYDAYINSVNHVVNILAAIGLGALSNLVGAGLVGGALAGELVGSLIDMYYDGLPRGYVEVKQYYHPNTYYYYTVVSLYKNSNYTGLIKRWEYGPTPPMQRDGDEL